MIKKEDPLLKSLKELREAFETLSNNLSKISDITKETIKRDQEFLDKIDRI